MMRENFFLLAKARCSSNICFNQLILNTVSHASLFVNNVQDKIDGIPLTRIKIVDGCRDAYPLIGLSRGGEDVKNFKARIIKTIDLITVISSLQIKFNQLITSIRSTNRRMNGLKYKILPELQATLARLSDQLQENEYEEHYRLKLIQKRRKNKSKIYTK